MFQLRKRRLAKVVYSRFFTLVLIFFTILIGINLVDLIKKNQEAKNNKIAAAEELERLEERAEKIRQKQEKMLTTIGTEEAIREKFSLKKPGEGEVIIVEEKKMVAGVAQSRTSFWNFLRNLFW